MGWTITKIDTVQSGSGWAFNLKQRLKAAGWTVYKSGTGTGGTYSETGDIIADSGSMERNSWFCMHSPTGSGLIRRDFLFKMSQYTNQSHTWYIQYTTDGVGFVTGTVSETTPPSASVDAGRLFLFHTNGFPAQLCPTEETYTTAYIVGDEDEKYSFFSPFISSTSGTVIGGFGVDHCTGSNPNDPDPAVVLVLQQNTGTPTFQAENGLFFKGGGATVGHGQFAGGWFAKETPQQQFVSMEAALLIDTNFKDLMDNFPTSSWDGTLDSFPIYYIRDGQRTSHHILKGESRIFKRHGDKNIAGGTTTPDGSRIIYQTISFPWTGSA